MLRRMLCTMALLALLMNLKAQKLYDEPYRPQRSFSPVTNWMNDPNGLVYIKGNTWHLFFQYLPYSTIWGPMHWGHAVSRDLLHWKRERIALYPDSLGYLFSGVRSSIVPIQGFGTKGKIPMVAIFTQHDAVGEKAGSHVFQNQSIAYSLDDGIHWLKYPGNPVIKIQA